MEYSIRRSAFDPRYFEVIYQGEVLQEIWGPLPIQKTPRSFPSLEAIEEWLLKTERTLARRSVLYWLGRKNYPKRALIEKLEKRGFSSLIALEMVEEFERLGYVSDADFLERAVEKELKKGYGPRYIEAKLRAQGLSSQGIRERIDEERQKEALLFFLKKGKKRDKDQMIQALLRRGFDRDLILKTI